MAWKGIIGRNPRVRSGKPIVLGTRLTVGDVLGTLATGMTVEEVIEDFPQLSREQILACLDFASHGETSLQAI